MEKWQLQSLTKLRLILHAAYPRRVSQSRNISACFGSIDEVTISHMNPGTGGFIQIDTVQTSVEDGAMEPVEVKENTLLDKI